MEKRTIPLLIILGFLAIVILAAIFATFNNIPIVAIDETNISIASFDFWSVGHFLWGVGLFVTAFTFGSIFHNLTGNPKDPINEPEFKKFVLYWVIIFIIAGIWEIVENTLFYFVGIKVKFDSWVNIITDIFLWGIGGCISWYMTDLMFLSDKYLRAYYIYGVMAITMGVIIFTFFGFLTTNY